MAHGRNYISQLTVKGFKSIGDKQQLAIKPLTILAGANSSGKSSIMQPLLLLKQTLEAPGDPGAILLDGEHVKFTSADQLFSRSCGGQLSSVVDTSIVLRNKEALSLSFHREEGKGIEVRKMTYRSENEKVALTLGMKHSEILKLLPTPFKSVREELQRQVKRDLRWNVIRDRCFLGFELVSADEEKPPFRLALSGMSPAMSFIPLLQGIIHLPGLRGNPRRTYLKTAVGPHFHGTFEPYVASVINEWQVEKSDSLRQLERSLKDLGLTWKVKAEPLEDTQIQLKVGRLVHPRRGGAHDMVSIADVGFGVSQSLPVVVSLIVAHPGQLVYLEQPEIHLHPLAQRALAKLLVSASARGVIVIAETHSSLLLREVQTLIAKGFARPEDVALHWFMRDENGCTMVTTAELDANGAYGDWPTDFDKTELASEQEYLDAVEMRDL